MDLGINISLKVHILTEHVTEFCKNHNNSLGLYSEQALESSHYDFLGQAGQWLASINGYLDMTIFGVSCFSKNYPIFQKTILYLKKISYKYMF